MNRDRLTVDQRDDGTWVVIRPVVVASGFMTSADAWAWIDRYDQEHQKWVDQVHRIGAAFAKVGS